MLYRTASPPTPHIATLIDGLLATPKKMGGPDWPRPRHTISIGWSFPCS